VGLCFDNILIAFECPKKKMTMSCWISRNHLLQIPIMKSILISIFKIVFLAGLLVHAQPVNAQLSPKDADPFYEVKDKTLHGALTKLRYIQAGSPTFMGNELFSPAYMKHGLELEKYFSDPEASKALWVLLDAIEKPGFEQLPNLARYRVMGAVVMAVGSGKSEFIPTLKRLAHHPNPIIRGAIASYDENRYAPSTSLEVLKESVLGAIEQLPQEPSKSQEFRARWDEFEHAVGLYCEFATPSQRDEIRPLVEKNLNRYGFLYVNYYRPRIEKSLSAETGFTVKTRRGKEVVVERKRDEIAIASERFQKTMFRIFSWGSGTLVALGLIFLMIKKWRRRQFLRQKP
jgi:hypothetical protein